VQNILIVDRDIGFAFWLGEILSNSGYLPLAGHDVPGALSLLDELNVAVDLLIFDPSLENAQGLIDALRQSNRRLRTLAVTDTPPGAIAPTASLGRPRDAGDAAKAQWLSKIQDLLSESSVATAAENSTPPSN
jgi:hypothetical protein